MLAVFWPLVGSTVDRAFVGRTADTLHPCLRTATINPFSQQILGRPRLLDPKPPRPCLEFQKPTRCLIPMVKPCAAASEIDLYLFNVGPNRGGEDGARCRIRTCDPFRVKEVLYH